VSSFSVVGGVNSDTAVERIAIPTLPTPAPVVKKTPTPTTKVTVKKPAPVAKKKPTVTCTKGAITRVFDGTKCPSGFKK
jgi:hypothetical protein